MNEPPQKIWLQWYGDSNDVSGIGYDQPEGVTWCADSMYQNDVCYIRAGKPTPIVRELQSERDAAIARAEAAEADLGELRENVLLALGMSPLDVQDGLEDSTIMLVVTGLVEANADLLGQLLAQAARAEAAEAEIAGMLEQESFLEAQLAHMREREADLLRTLHVKQDAHDRLREQQSEVVLTTEQEIVAMSFRYKELKHEITALQVGFGELRQQLEPLLNILVKREF